MSAPSRDVPLAVYAVVGCLVCAGLALFLAWLGTWWGWALAGALGLLALSFGYGIVDSLALRDRSPEKGGEVLDWPGDE